MIGLAVGIPLGLTAVYFLVRRKPTPSPKKPEANAEAPAKPTGENIPVGNAGKTDQASLGNGQTMPGPTGQHIPVRNGSGGIDHPPEVPIRDREELYEPKNNIVTRGVLAERETDSLSLFLIVKCFKCLGQCFFNQNFSTISEYHN